MRLASILLAILFICGPLYAEIIIDWKTFPRYTDIQKNRIAKEVEKAYAKFASSEFADLGQFAWPVNIVVKVSDIGTNYGTYCNGVISLSPKILTRDKLRPAVIFHEFSHAYDYMYAEKQYESASLDSLNNIASILILSEKRAQQKTKIFCKKYGYETD